MPPRELIHRTGCLGANASIEAHDEMSGNVRAILDAMLPPDWGWDGKRVLDFGCGAGRVLRHFAPESATAEFWGCDIHGPSIEWMKGNLCPPFHAFQTAEEPALPQEDGYFDLIYAVSVYTHITEHWAGWLLEHHRVLADDGLLLVSFLGEGMIKPLIGEEWDEDRIGMNSLRAGFPWDLGGPITFHSPWWLRAHWGRAFEIEALVPHAGVDAPAGHGMILLRRKPVTLTVEELERLEPDEPREILALQHHVEQLRAETLGLRHEIEAVAQPRPWSLRIPLRAAARAVRRRG